MHNPTILSWIEKTDFQTLTSEKAKALSTHRAAAIGDALEDYNCHSALAVLLALRNGTPRHILDARAILSAHESTGYITKEISDRRAQLLRDIFPIPKTPDYCACGHTLKKPGCGYFTQAGWECKQCGEIHTEHAERRAQ